ncbi:hypothetical protein HB162lentus_08910 [Mammaliicoccus lentus]
MLKETHVNFLNHEFTKNPPYLCNINILYTIIHKIVMKNSNNSNNYF